MSNTLMCWTIVAVPVADGLVFFPSRSESHEDLPHGTQVLTSNSAFSFLGPMFVVGSSGSLGCTGAVFLVLESTWTACMDFV